MNFLIDKLCFVENVVPNVLYKNKLIVIELDFSLFFQRDG